MKHIILFTALGLIAGSALAQETDMYEMEPSTVRQQPAQPVVMRDAIQATPVDYNASNVPKTRAEVKQELIEAEQNGTIPKYEGRGGSR